VARCPRARIVLDALELGRDELGLFLELFFWPAFSPLNEAERIAVEKRDPVDGLTRCLPAFKEPNLDELFGRFEIPVPPKAEQREIVRRVNELFALADALMQRIESASRRVDRSSQAVLAKALRGDLAVDGIATNGQ
jgi:type I restriction enzyme S subunit